MPGPPPKRQSERRRRNKDVVETETVNLANLEGPVQVPVADADWHPIATQWYDSLKSSGQIQFYEPSDWATAYMIAESISRDLKPQVVGIDENTGKPIFATVPMKGANLTAYLKAMTALLVTEGDRRRSRIEIERANAAATAEKAKGATVTSISQTRENRFRRDA